ncbi:Npt1/Npt2 family nucleotide transporter [Paenibacillus sp.]|uniref:Npt1/Npt2 family nucleotide transporter n=1 Tax=Paenibacillus sp. TaxID=58172 RepID=UPI002D6E7845|nr:Npt1/Npt2 family nucleotide transporter [Paenibacillus sp.]HZG87909.1 Npt1/Npt2 family nucleotide transporter [Paenibacillus sp.]
MRTFAGKPLSTVMARISEDKEEYGKVGLLFIYLLFVSAASTVGRTAADALFLTYFDSSVLSKMYLPQAAALIATGMLFQRYGSRVRLDRLLYVLIPSLALAVLLTRAGIGLEVAWVLPFIYVAYDVFNFLMIVCFWQFVSAVLDQRKAKRMIGWVGSGGIVGGIVSGFGLKLAVAWTGTANLIFVYAALQLLALAIVHRLIRRSGNREEAFGGSAKAAPRKASVAAKRRQSEGGAVGLFQAVPHLTYVAIMSAALILALTFVDYQFKVILRNELSDEQLAGFMGGFHGVAGLLALLVQLFVAGKTISRFGVTTAILVFPVVLLAGSAGLLLFPVLAMAVVVKGSDKVVGDTINSSVNQLIMFPIAPEWRNKAKSFLDGIVRNGAKGAAAIGIMFLSPFLSERAFAAIIIGLLVVSIAAAIRIKGGYLRMLLASLQTNQARHDEAEIDFMDPASKQLLAEALRSPRKQQALYAFRVLGRMDSFDLAPYLPGLLAHPSEEVAIEALRYIERHKPLGMESEVERLLSRDRVRSHAVMALAAFAKEEHFGRLTAALQDPDLQIKSSAIAGLIKYYGIEGMFEAVDALKWLLDSEDDEERSAVAALFGSIGIKEFHKPLIPLLQDPSTRVRKQALRSAGVLQVPELIAFLVPLVDQGATRKDAIDALAAYDEKTLIPMLQPYFAQDSAPLHLLAVFERKATPAAMSLLIDMYPTSGFEIKNRLLEALSRMRRGNEPTEAQKHRLQHIFLEETSLYWNMTERLAGLSAIEGYKEMVDVGIQSRSVIAWRLFQVLGLMYDAATIRSVYAGWRSGEARQQANAMEVADQVTQGAVRLELARVMSDSGAIPPAARSEHHIKEQVDWLSMQDDAWLRQVIRHSRGEDETGELQEHMERIRQLRNYSLFQDLASRDLSELAALLTEIRVKPDEYIFTRHDPGNSLYLVRSGKVGLYRDGVKLSERKANESFGKSGLLVERERSADAKADTDVVVLALRSEDFYEAMFDRSSIAIEMMKRLSRRLRDLLARQQGGSQVSAQARRGSEAEAVREAAVATADEAKSDSILRRVLILQHIDLFSHLAEEDLMQLAQLVDEVELEAGESICRTGDYGDTLYGIIEGSVKVHREDMTFAVLGEGDCFGEMAILDSGPRSADCSAIEPTLLLELHKEQVFSLCFQNMDVLRGMMQVMGERIKDLTE